MMEKKSPSQGPSMPPPNHVAVGYKVVGGVYKGMELAVPDKYKYPNRNSSFAPKLKSGRKKMGKSEYEPFRLEPAYQKLQTTVAQDPMMQGGSADSSPGAQTRGAAYPHTIQTHESKPVTGRKR